MTILGRDRPLPHPGASVEPARDSKFAASEDTKIGTRRSAPLAGHWADRCGRKEAERGAGRLGALDLTFTGFAVFYARPL